MSSLGFFWVVSNDTTQQKLLKWSMILAKRHYPELPHCVATSDNSFSCDAQMIYFEPTRDDPSHESVYALHLSPFDTTYFLCNRSMIIFRFDHLLSGVPFQTSKHFFEENNDPHGMEEDNAIVVYDKHIIKQFHSWLSTQKIDWIPWRPRHILHEWRKHYPDYYVNEKLMIDSEANKKHFMKAFDIQSRRELCGVPLPLWFRFPIFDLDTSPDVFYNMVIKDKTH